MMLSASGEDVRYTGRPPHLRGAYSMKSVISPLVLALALSAPFAMGQDIYRSTMPDGSIRYGESPDPNAKSSKKVAAPPPATGVNVVTPDEKGRLFATPQGGVSVM